MKNTAMNPAIGSAFELFVLLEIIHEFSLDNTEYQKKFVDTIKTIEPVHYRKWEFMRSGAYYHARSICEYLKDTNLIPEKIYHTGEQGALKKTLVNKLKMKEFECTSSNIKNNPSDILIITTDDEYVGLSLKYNENKKNNCLYNGGVIKLNTFIPNAIDNTIYECDELQKKYPNLTYSNKDTLKNEIREDYEIKKWCDARGNHVLTNFRDELYDYMIDCPYEMMKNFIQEILLGVDTIPFPSVFVCSYYASNQESDIYYYKERYILELINSNSITLEKVGNNTINILNNGNPFLSIRFKHESQSMASAIKYVIEGKV